MSVGSGRPFCGDQCGRLLWTAGVPSRANLVYNKAFLRNDEERRRAFLGAVKKGETTIHAGVLFPHDIVHSYMKDGECTWTKVLAPADDTLEELWKSLPDYVQGAGNTLCIALTQASIKKMPP